MKKNDNNMFSSLLLLIRIGKLTRKNKTSEFLLFEGRKKLKHENKNSFLEMCLHGFDSMFVFH